MRLLAPSSASAFSCARRALLSFSHVPPHDGPSLLVLSFLYSIVASHVGNAAWLGSTGYEGGPNKTRRLN